MGSFVRPHEPETEALTTFPHPIVALYEGITIQPQFAHFFLSFLRGEKNYFHMLSDLSTIDRTLHNNIMFLKTYEDEAEDLCLTFSIANDDFGENKEINLIPNGSEISVTNDNKHRYIGTSRSECPHCHTRL